MRAFFISLPIVLAACEPAAPSAAIAPDRAALERVAECITEEYNWEDNDLDAFIDWCDSVGGWFDMDSVPEDNLMIAYCFHDCF